MKKALIFMLLFVMLFSITTGCKKATVTDAILEIGTTIEEPYDKSSKYDLDERIKCFQSFSPNSQGWLHFNNTQGLMAIIFSTKENPDTTVLCTIKEIYVDSNTIGIMGWITNIDKIKELIGEDITFTLYLNENNVVTSDDFPTLLS